MGTCFLFGHANTPRSAYPALVEAIENEISKGTKIFYVGYHGNFDRMAIAALRLAKQKHDIVAALVLPYIDLLVQEHILGGHFQGADKESYQTHQASQYGMRRGDIFLEY